MHTNIWMLLCWMELLSLQVHNHGKKLFQYKDYKGRTWKFSGLHMPAIMSLTLWKSLWTSWAIMHSCCSSRSCSLLTRRILSHGQTCSYLLDLFYQAYCYNTVTNHKYTFIIFLRCLGKRGLISASSAHPLIFSSSLSVLYIFLLLQFYFIFISDQSLTFPYSYESAAPVSFPWHLVVTCFQILLLTCLSAFEFRNFSPHFDLLST